MKEKKLITDAFEKQKKQDIADFHKIGSEGFNIEEMKHDAEKMFLEKKIKGNVDNEVEKMKKAKTEEWLTKKSQMMLDIQQRDRIVEIKNRLLCAPVTEAEKIEIFKVIRWD